MAQTIGIVGLGLLGSALAGRLHRSGYQVIGYDLSPAARQAFQELGGGVKPAARDVAAECDILILSLPDSKVVAAVIAEIELALRAGQIVIDTTTGEPADAATLGDRLQARGVKFVEATVGGSSAQVAARDAIVMAGGDVDTVQSARVLLGCFARDVFHVGPWGQGSRMKLVVNLVLGLHRAALAEGLTLAKAQTLDPGVALAILKSSPAYSTVMDTKGAKMLSGDFTPQAKLSQHLKDVRLILAAARQNGVELPLSAVHQELLARVEAAGHGELDNSAILLAFGGAPPG